MNTDVEYRNKVVAQRFYAAGPMVNVNISYEDYVKTDAGEIEVFCMGCYPMNLKLSQALAQLASEFPYTEMAYASFTDEGLYAELCDDFVQRAYEERNKT